MFVTHGGIGSVSEAIYHKAALVGIPFSNDQVDCPFSEKLLTPMILQKPNLLRAQMHGYAKLLEWDNINQDDLRDAIVEAMESKDMQESLETVNR